MKKMTFIFTGLVFLLLAACATKPVAFDSEKSSGTWEAKALIKDLKGKKQNTVSLEVVAEKSNALRMEVSGTMGVSVASFLMTGETVQYAIHTQKRAFSGKNSEKALSPLFQISLNPKYLENIFFDESISEKNWSCTQDNQGLVARCERLSDRLQIEWKERNGENKRVLIQSPEFEVQVLVKSFTTKVEDPGVLESLTIPESYRRYKLR